MKNCIVVMILVGLVFSLPQVLLAQESALEAMKRASIDSGALKIVDDPLTAEALNVFQKKSAEIGQSCPKPEGADFQAIMAKMNECVCANLPAFLEATQTKVDAVADLLRRKPELANQMVNIKGVFGNLMLNPSEINKQYTLEDLKTQYNCQ